LRKTIKRGDDYMANRRRSYYSRNHRMIRDRRYVNGSGDFNGNVARAIDYSTEYEQEDTYSQIHKKIRQNKHRENVREERARQSRLRRLEKSVGINIKTCALFVSVVAVMLVFCINYLKVRADVTKLSKEVAEKETEVNNLKTKNDSVLKEVESKVDLQEIYKVATKDLGMVFVDKNRVIKYKGNESAYVEQYEDLPEEYKKNVYDDIINSLK